MTDESGILQRILDEQGFVIMGCAFEKRIGEVSPRFDLNCDEAVDSPVVAIAETTRKAWKQQNKKYFGDDRRYEDHSGFRYFYRMAAE